jgi:DNA-binding LytR/AlgR family response regulator
MMTCIAIDDEPLALDLLEDNISKIPFLKLVKKCANALEANTFLNEQSVDLVFLDIQMVYPKHHHSSFLLRHMNNTR